MNDELAMCSDVTRAKDTANGDGASQFESSVMSAERMVERALGASKIRKHDGCSATLTCCRIGPAISRQLYHARCCADALDCSRSQSSWKAKPTLHIE